MKEPTDYFKYYSDVGLTPSQCAEWISEQAMKMQTHIVAEFGWMSQGSVDHLTGFHLEKALDHLDRLRALGEILEHHVIKKTAILEANEESA